MSNGKDWGVMLTDAALDELGAEIKQHLTEGTTGSCILCKHVDMHQQYLRMVMDYTLPDGSPFEFEIYMPHQYVKLIMAGSEEKLKKVMGFTGTSK